MKSAGQVRVVVVRRGRGRPRLDTVRVECCVPRQVLDKLVQEEARSGTYRTRVAAHILCNWAGVQAPDCHESSSYASQ
jgi:hypothetical protein